MLVAEWIRDGRAQQHTKLEKEEHIKGVTVDVCSCRRNTSKVEKDMYQIESRLCQLTSL